MTKIKGVSEAFNHAVEWDSKRWDEKKGISNICPALRATDYKCPKYVWYYDESD